MDTKLDLRTENELRKATRRKVMKAFETIIDESYRWSVKEPVGIIDEANEDDICEALDKLDVEDIAYVISGLARKARDAEYYTGKYEELKDRNEELEGRINHLKDILDGE